MPGSCSSGLSRTYHSNLKDHPPFSLSGGLFSFRTETVTNGRRLLSVISLLPLQPITILELHEQQRNQYYHNQEGLCRQLAQLSNGLLHSPYAHHNSSYPSHTHVEPW